MVGGLIKNKNMHRAADDIMSVNSGRSKEIAANIKLMLSAK